MTDRFVFDPLDVAVSPGVPLGEVLDLTRPVHVEVGFGKDIRILRAAEAAPDAWFVGVEISRKKVVSFRNKVARAGLRNVRAYQSDVRHFLADLTPGTITSFTILFPDPWPKRRQNKHRWIQPLTAKRLADALVGGGRVTVATDHDGYIEHIRECFDGVGLTLVEERRDVPEPDRSLFAERFQRLGETVTHQTWVKHRSSTA